MATSGDEPPTPISLDEWSDEDEYVPTLEDPIFTAAREGDTKTLKDMLNHNPDLVNSTDYLGATPLHTASSSGEVDSITLLLEKGAHIDHVDNDGQTPLHLASWSGEIDAIRLLVEKGANIDHVDNLGQTPLHLASSYGEEDVIRLLVEKGANIDHVDNDGETPLHKATWNSKVDSIQLLLQKGANIDHVNNDGDTPLHYATIWGKLEAVKALIEHGANIHTTNKAGNTPLHYATFWGKLEAVKALIERGADIHTTNKKGETPLLTAVNGNEGSVVRYLINDKKMDITQLDQPTQLKITGLLGDTNKKKVSSDSTPNSSSQDDTSTVDANLIMAYEAAMKEGSESSNQFKLVTLGAEGAGKTSSVNTLLNLPFKSNQESTVGASVNSCTIDMHLASSKWKKITAAFQVTEIPKQYKREVKAAVYSKPVKPVASISVQPIPQEVINEVKQIITSKEEMPQDGHIRIVIFDIGGQEVYYDVHFLFLAIEDVALLVFDCSMGLDDPVISRHRTGRFGEKIATRGMQSNIKTIELLLHSVYSRGQTAPPGSISPRVPVVIMLGAHAEGLSDEEKELIVQKICQRFDGKPFLEHLPQLKEEAFHFLANSNPNPKSVEHLRSTVLKAAELVITTKRPISYLKFEGKILEKIQHAAVRLSRSEAIDIARSFGVEGEEAVDALLRYFTNKGILLYYPEVKSLKNDIFISPQEVSDLVCAVITTHECRPPTADLQQSYHRYNQYALLEEALLNFILQQFGRSKDKEVLLGLLDKFNLAAEVPVNTRFSHEISVPSSRSSKVFVVPPLLVYDNKVPYCKQDGDIVVQYYFPDGFLPECIFNQLLVKTILWCCKHSHVIRCIRRGVGYFSFENAHLQQFQLQWCQSTSSINCYITIQHSHQPPSEMLPILLQQRRQLITYLESSVAEVSKGCMPSAKPPVTCLECPLHDEHCTPHITLNIDRKNVLVCHKEVNVAAIPEQSYILLYQESAVVCSPSTVLAQKPKIIELVKIVIPEVAAHWETLAFFLEFEMSRVEIIREKCSKDPERCCREVFIHWLNSKEGISPKTWETLLKTLKEVSELTAAAEQIEKQLKQRYM